MPTVLGAVICILFIFGGMVTVSYYDWNRDMVLPLLSPFLVFCLFSVLIETPWFLRLLGRAFLSKESLDRLSLEARQELKTRINLSIAGTMENPDIEDLSKALAKEEPALLSPYYTEKRLLITHRPFPKTKIYIESTMRQTYRLMNPRSEPIPFGKAFETSMVKVDLEDSPKSFELLAFQILDNSDKEIARYADPDVKQVPDEKTDRVIFSLEATNVTIPGNSFVRVWFESKRVIPLRDVYEYSVGEKPTKDLEIEYSYSELAKHQRALHPHLALYARVADVAQLPNQPRCRIWRIKGWLVKGDGFTLSW
jgi:hypothetical protein